MGSVISCLVISGEQPEDTFIVQSPITCPENVTVAWSPHPQHTGSTVSRKYSGHDVSLSTLTNLSSRRMSLLLGSLFGITCVQVYIYYGKNFKDRLLFKLVVQTHFCGHITEVNCLRQIAFLWYKYHSVHWGCFLKSETRFLDTFHLALITHVSYYYLVSNFGNIAAVGSPTWWVFHDQMLNILLQELTWVNCAGLCLLVITALIFYSPEWLV